MLKCISKKSLLPAGVLLAISLGVTVHAEERSTARDLTPWILDAIKLQQGLESELDWTSSIAPDFNEIEAILSTRPTLSGPELTVETPHFLIHYTLEGRDAATDEQALWSADALEFTWNREINEMGYPEPASDGTAGGDARYDVYWTKQVGTYGYASGDEFVDENSMTSYLALATWLDQPETQVTVAHEFFHALHFTMDSLEETWWYEVSSTWMEDMVYDDINDYYNYVSDVFSNPEVPVSSSSTIMYGASIFAHSLSERFGPDVVRDIWFEASDTVQPEALRTTRDVVDRAGDWNEAIQYYRESLWDLARFSEGDGYADAISSNGQPGEVSFTQSVSTYPTESRGSIDGTGANLIEFMATSTEPGTLTVNYGGGNMLVASLLVETRNGTIEELFSDTEVGAGETFTVSDFGQAYSRAVLVVTNVALDGTSNFDFDVNVPEWDGGGTGCALVPNQSNQPVGGLALSIVGLFAGLLLVRRRTA